MAQDHATRPVRAERADGAAAGFGAAAPVHALAAAAGLLNAGPAVAAQHKLAKRLAHGSGAPIQRYRKINHARVSDGGDLCLIGKRDLYAADAQFAQANALPGAVAFRKSDKVPPSYLNTHVNDLHLVKPVLKPNIDMPGMRTNADRGVTHVTRRDIRDDFTWRNDPNNRPDGYNARNARKYKQSLRGAEGPMLPTDCGHTSTVVSGHSNQPLPHASTVMQPGSVYRLGSNDAQAEWPYHYAAVTMTDGADHVTMENAAGKRSKQFSKYLLDKGWWFEMYGPAHGQSFLEKYQHDLPNGQLGHIHPTPPAPAPQQGGGIGGFLSSVGRGIVGVGSSIGSGIATVGSGIGSGIAAVGHGIGSGAASVGRGIAHGIGRLKFW